MTNNTLLAKIEQLKAIRPDLAKRTDAAVSLLTEHFSNPARRVIVARVQANGQVSYTVKGKYQVTHNSCTCPDANDPRRSGVCKHQLAVRALEAVIEHKHGEAVTTTAPQPQEWQPVGGWLSDTRKASKRRVEVMEEV